MKKIIKCVLLLIVAYFVVSISIHFITKPYYKDFKGYEIVSEEAKVEVTECKNSYTKGYIKGNISNTTEEIIDAVCMKVNIYNKKGNYLGTEYYPISYFYPQETINFEVNYSYKNVGHIKIEVVNKELVDDKFAIFDEIDDNNLAYLELTLLLINPVIILTALGL